MRHLFFVAVIIILGAAALAPAISYIGLDPMPGDFAVNLGDWHLMVPVTYSLCASCALGLFYYFLKR